MKSVSKSRIKAKMFELFRDLEEHGGESIVTDQGKPILKISRIKGIPRSLTIDEAFAELRNKVRIPWESAIDITESEWPER